MDITDYTVVCATEFNIFNVFIFRQKTKTIILLIRFVIISYINGLDTETY